MPNSNGRMTKKVICMKRPPVSVPWWRSKWTGGKQRKTFTWVSTPNWREGQQLKPRSSWMTPTKCNEPFPWTLLSAGRMSRPAVPQRQTAPPPRPRKASVTTAQCSQSLCVSLHPHSSIDWPHMSSRHLNNTMRISTTISTPRNVSHSSVLIH